MHAGENSSLPPSNRKGISSKMILIILTILMKRARNSSLGEGMASRRLRRDTITCQRKSCLPLYGPVQSDKEDGAEDEEEYFHK